MNARGFSYVEIIFTVAIVALMATAVVPYVELTVTRKKEAELRQNLRQIRNALDEFKQAVTDGKIMMPADASGYPPNLEVLVDGFPNAQDPQQRPIYFLRRLPSDPMYEGTVENAADTWGKRSYDSPPDAPAEGKDVFDVFSLSEKSGLNGVPYNEW
jgi:general secretion pathway protein G